MAASNTLSAQNSPFLLHFRPKNIPFLLHIFVKITPLMLAHQRYCLMQIIHIVQTMHIVSAPLGRYRYRGAIPHPSRSLQFWGERYRGLPRMGLDYSQLSVVRILTTVKSRKGNTDLSGNSRLTAASRRLSRGKYNICLSAACKRLSNGV